MSETEYYLIGEATTGLGDRLVLVSHLIRCARYLKLKPAVLWRHGKYMDCPYEALYDNSTPITVLSAWPENTTIYSGVRDISTIENTEGNIGLINVHNYINVGKVVGHLNDMSEIRVNRAIWNRAKEIAEQHSLSEACGVHMRRGNLYQEMPWSDLARSKFFELRCYFEAIETYGAKDQKIFISTDSPSEILEYKKYFGTARILPRELLRLDEVNEAEQGMLEMLLLAYCGVMIHGPCVFSVIAEAFSRVLGTQPRVDVGMRHDVKYNVRGL